uniref:Vomeronasal type-1 receptor n=1 Tax=Mandrillus leucophaeus TaxID=9568 RepID=A0A2K5ZBJ8_MANLE
MTASRDLAIGMIFLSQIIFLLYHYSFLCFTRGLLWSTDLILKHLTIANSLVILTKGIPQTMAAFGLKDTESDIGCKLVFYGHRVGRAVCIGNACLLSIFQVITISPCEFRWAQLKLHAPRYIGSSNILVLCWILNMLVNITVPLHMTGKWNSINSTKTNDYKCCSGGCRSRILCSLHIVLLSSLHVSCVGRMTLASDSMVFILHRGKQQVQHIQGTNLSPRSLLTPSVILLALLHLYMSLFPNPMNTSALMTACFPTVSLFVLMNHHPRIPRLGSACCGENTQFPKLVR